MENQNLQNMKINCCLDSTGQNTSRSGSLLNDSGALFAAIILVPFIESSPNQVTPSWINIAALCGGNIKRTGAQLVKAIETVKVCLNIGVERKLALTEAFFQN